MADRSLALIMLGPLTVACGTNLDGIGPDAGPSSACEPMATASCYGGPEGTDGVGPCRPGTRICADDGSGWGGCEGEVGPISEVCSNGVDDDCNGAADDVADEDGDGFTHCTGDCCETTAQCAEPARVNPRAVEVPTVKNGFATDDDCDGQIDELSEPCDGDLALDDADPINAAHAIGLCSDSVLSARYVRANGAPAEPTTQVGLLDNFGPNVPAREGSRLLALSSGRARRSTDADACAMDSCLGFGPGTAPPGFPQDVAGCPGSPDIMDDIGLELQLRAPSNAVGYAIEFSFYTFEYPEWVCTQFNDHFIVLASPSPAGAINGNIAFDAQLSPVSANFPFDVCSGCSQGTAALGSTGFDLWNDAGATGWLTSQAPIEPGGELTLRLTIWDSGDHAFDSTVIIDNFHWILGGSPTVNTSPAP